MSNAENPRAVIGANQAQAGDIAQRITEQMADEYGELAGSVAALLDRARILPESVEDEETLRKFSNIVVDMRDASARAEAARKMEKEPYLRGGQAVDGFFNGLSERLTKGIGVLSKRAHAYNERKLAAERERRRLEAEETARIARAKLEAEEKARREAEEARQAAERARKPETIEAKGQIAAEAEAAASAATTAAAMAVDVAQEARIETLRKSADLVRTRFDEGRLVSMRQVGYVEVVDRALLDMNLLRPYFTDNEIEKALRGWGKATGFKRQMDGAIVELRDDTVIR